MVNCGMVETACFCAGAQLVAAVGDHDVEQDDEHITDDDNDLLPSGVLPRMESTTSTRRLVPMALMPMQAMSMDQTFRYWLLSMYHLKPPMPGIRRSTTFANRITIIAAHRMAEMRGGDLVQSGLQFFTVQTPFQVRFR